MSVLTSLGDFISFSLFRPFVMSFLSRLKKVILTWVLQTVVRSAAAIRELIQITSTTVSGTSQQLCTCVQDLGIFLSRPFKITTWNCEILSYLVNLKHHGELSIFQFGTEVWLCMLRLSWDSYKTMPRQGGGHNC